VHPGLKANFCIAERYALPAGNLPMDTTLSDLEVTVDEHRRATEARDRHPLVKVRRTDDETLPPVILVAMSEENQAPRRKPKLRRPGAEA
jgi:hypothetical protein